MTPVRYTTEILPDGHLPLPAGFPGRAGERVDVSVSPAEAADDSVARRQREEGQKVAGSLATGTTDGGVNHDKYIYGGPRA